MKRHLTRAVAGGLDRLLAAQEHGRWRGFPTLAGESDVWVTAFVVAHLREFKGRAPALRHARAFLASARHASGGWSYGGEVPPDADSTAWCLLALGRSRALTANAARDARRFLATHTTRAGVSTYRDDGEIRRYISADASVSMDGWTSPHPDVTVSAMLAGVPSLTTPEGTAALARLVSRQSGAGFWDAYWWRGPLYTTTLILRAVDAAEHRLPRDVALRLLRALQREQLPGGGFALGAAADPNPFSTALALECLSRLAYLGAEDARRAAAASLLTLQSADGGWAGDYVLRIPAPHIVEPRHVSGWSRGTGGGNSYVADSGGTFATALACYALTISERTPGATQNWGEIPVAVEPATDETLVAVQV